MDRLLHSSTFLLFCMIYSATNAQDIVSTPFNPRSTPASNSASRFEELSAEVSGIDFVQPIDKTHPLKCLYVGGYASPGLAIGDLDGDGLADLFISGGPVPSRLYLNSSSNGQLTFTDASQAAGIVGNDWSAGATMVDIDNDGDLDIYVCNYDSPNQLFLNETKSPGKPKFREAAKAFGLDLVDASFVSAFCDYDLDGDLDVLVSAYQYVNPKGRPAKPPVEKQGDKYVVLPGFEKYYGVVKGIDGRPTFTNVGRQDYLLRSNASEAAGKSQIRFTDVTQQAGLADRGVGNSVLWWDFDGDGLSDIYIGNDFKVADQLYHNNGDGTFTDVVESTFPHTTWFSMGSEAGDINNDGRLDLFVSDMAGTTHYRSKVTMGEMSVHRDFMKTAEPRQYMRNALLINTGTPRFLEAAYMAGLAKSDWSWAVKLADLDNDGMLDVFITNGAARMFNHSDRNFTDSQRIGKTQWELWEDSPPRNEENLAFRNKGDLKFHNVSEDWGLKKNGMSYSAAYGDLDNDGDLDLVVANLEEPVSIYRNNSSDGQSIRFRLVGNKSNRSGLSATVQLRNGESQQFRQSMPTMGFLSCNEPILHFGVGEAKSVDDVVVTWPSGVRQSFSNLAANQLHTITEPTASAAKREQADAFKIDVNKLLFMPSRTFPSLRHVEKEYDDYARQPLLPYAHSQLGPAIATADVDGDGDMDFYHGRAAGTKRAVYLNQGGGKLAVNGVFADTKHEDMGALFFDADRDGDQDLYVVSGGVECEPNSEVLRDRLYLNDGKGKFVQSESALPDLRDSGSVVCGADYDQDGDIDLFVGGRVVPGKYPVSPKSRLLQNDSQPSKPKFIDVTTSAAAGVLSSGLVTSAIWSDANDDGWLDLLVTHEWGPVKLFLNEPANAGDRARDKQARRLVDRTKETGLQTRYGWWNGIAARDLDNDGDIDYVVTNFGLNTQYKASDKKPELLYYGSFDGGAPRLLEAKYEADKCFPRRGLSCSSHAMPFVREKVKTFHNFGMSTLQEIYSEKKLNESLQLSANSLESGIYINDGTTGTETVPQFRFVSLPRMAQISPSFGVVAHDFNADGYCDLFLGQNFFSPQLETGRMDSGLSTLLLGRGLNDSREPAFEIAEQRESGILIPGDAKACSIVDFNQDGWSDLLVTVNNGPIQAFEALPQQKRRQFRVKLLGKNGNTDCVGAKVTVEFDNAPDQTTEVAAGGGYLSQSTTILSFGAGEKGAAKVVRVRWPDGTSTVHAVKPGQMALAIRMK